MKWRGLLELKNDRITRLALRADGSEKLKWGNVAFPDTKDVARLPAGHPIDLSCAVRYGVTAGPAGGR